MDVMGEASLWNFYARILLSTVLVDSELSLRNRTKRFLELRIETKKTLLTCNSRSLADAIHEMNYCKPNFI